MSALSALVSGLPVGAVGVALAVFVVVTAAVTAALRDTAAIVVVFAAYSLGMAIFYAVLLAPDVAMTEAAIGAGVTTLLLLLAIAKTTRPADVDTFESIDGPALLLVGGLLVAVLVTVTQFPALGSPTAWAWDSPVSQYYIAESYADTGVENAVTAVLAGYRGFDTFGEAVVIFAAGVAALLVLRAEVFTRE